MNLVLKMRPPIIGCGSAVIPEMRRIRFPLTTEPGFQPLIESTTTLRNAVLALLLMEGVGGFTGTISHIFLKKIFNY